MRINGEEIEWGDLEKRIKEIEKRLKTHDADIEEDVYDYGSRGIELVDPDGLAGDYVDLEVKYMLIQGRVSCFSDHDELLEFHANVSSDIKFLLGVVEYLDRALSER